MNKMNVKDARAILGVSRDCSLVELKKRYHILALKLHPDKNGNTVEATAAFQKLNQAYRLLLLDVDLNGDASKIHADEDNYTYSNIFMNFVKSLFSKKRKSENDEDVGVNPVLMDLLHRIVNDYASVSVNLLLDSLDPTMLFQLYETLEQYNSAVRMDDGIFDEITRVIREKMQKNNFIILKPSLKDVIQNNISVVQFEGQTFYVPLWHSELHYRIESEHDASKQLIVKCMPELPEHMSIDANNELHIDVRADIKELLNRGSGVLRIPLYDSEFVEVQVKELHVMSRQTIVLRNNKYGISLICSTNIYDVANKAPICVHVHLF
jgi:curved DNA-binding protein CbpA